MRIQQSKIRGLKNQGLIIIDCLKVLQNTQIGPSYRGLFKPVID